MAKGDDAVTRKKNKSRRKKLQQNDKSTVSARVASIIAAKKRRLSGKRRKCQGMCFSLPTPDDPFNDKNGKSYLNLDNKTKVSKKIADRNGEKRGKSVNNVGGKSEKVKRSRVEVEESLDSCNQVEEKNDVSNATNLNGGSCVHLNQERTNCISYETSKFLILCMDEIENGLYPGCNTTAEDTRLHFDPWGLEFMRCFLTGQDIIETSGRYSTNEQIAWMVSVAADAIVRLEKEDRSPSNPFLLYIVPSQQKAVQVRNVCKFLKGLGVHAVSIHPGASLEHQIQGLKSIEPEFLVATPGRLLELVSLKAIDISGVSFLIIEGLESFHMDGCLNALELIRRAISGNPLTVVFNDLFSHASTSALQNVLTGPINRISFDVSLPSQSACITQTVDVFNSKEVMLSKGFNSAHLSQICSRSSKVLYIIGKEGTSNGIVEIINASSTPNSKASDLEKRSKQVASVIYGKDINKVDLSMYEVVILPNFVVSMDDYMNILKRMARYTAKGVLHSFLTEEDAPLAALLMEVLRYCGQLIPEALKNLYRQR